MKKRQADADRTNRHAPFLKGDEDGGRCDGDCSIIPRRRKWHDITIHTGFTLNDLVSYDGKHNEENGTES